MNANKTTTYISFKLKVLLCIVTFCAKYSVEIVEFVLIDWWEPLKM